jgi:uncharacterized protein (TIGR02001 family)
MRVPAERPFLIAGVALLATTGATAQADEVPGAAQDATRGRFEATANVAFVSDYRSRGLSYTDNDAALQGGFDVAERSGWSAGVWASSISGDAGSTLEMDLYAARSFDVGETEISLGATAFIYPDAEEANYGEALATLSRVLGPVDASFSVNYAWEQANLGDEDNFYVTLGGASLIGRWGSIPVSLGASVGYEEGALAIEDAKTDWSLSMTADLAGMTFGLSYVDTDLTDEPGDPAGVISLSRAF